VIASEKLDQDSPMAGYGVIVDVLRAAEIPIQKRPTILLLPMRSPFIRDLRGIFATTTDVYGMRLGGQTFGDKYIEEAFVYRIR
jgi:hypothetical protein